MTRRYLGVDKHRTQAWLIFGSCLTCTLFSAKLGNRGYSWKALKEHLTNAHTGDEFCLECKNWIEDEYFIEHVWNRHDKDLRKEEPAGIKTTQSS